jgi:hypothetical protein
MPPWAASLSRCLAFGGAALLASCASTPPPPLSNDPRVSIAPPAGLALAAAPVVTTNADGITQVSIITGEDVAANCIADWYDLAGHPLGGLSSMPQRIAAARYAPTSCELVSPTPRARAFSVQIVPTE